MTTGLVIGKFYPPHLGHKYLVDYAQDHVDQLTIIVCYKKTESIAGELRAKWMQENHPLAKVILFEDIYDPNDSEFWARKTIEILGYRPDKVFTSENYGPVYCKFLGSKHVMVDNLRKTFPVSGTAVRNNPFTNWQYLSPIVKAYFAKRIVIVGAESTGKTTLAKELAAKLKTNWVPEYGRSFYEGKMSSGKVEFTTADFCHIAKMQNQLEDELAKSANKYLVCDTDAFATTIWHERYMKKPSYQVREIAWNQRPELYVLTDVNTPFVQDGTRNGKKIRHWMHKRFIEELKAQNRKFIEVSGTTEQRIKQIVGQL